MGGIFLNNCKLGLHGPIEVVSRKALEVYAAHRNACEEPPQEDVYLMACLLKNGARQLDMFNVLAEKDCWRDGWHQDPDWRSCTSDRAAFHPFKTPQAYQQCAYKATH